MSAVKLTMIFNVVTGSEDDPAAQRTGGWSESVYADSIDDAVKRDFRQLAQARAGLLPNSAKITALRYQQVDPSARASSESVAYKGRNGATDDTDLPQAALLFSATTVDGLHSRRSRIVCVPDFYIVKGEYKPTQAYTRAMNAYFRELSGWFARVRDFAQERASVTSITAAGVMTALNVGNYNRGDTVTIYSTVATNGKKVTGNFKVTGSTINGVTPLANWDAGDCVKGTVQKAVYTVKEIVTQPNFPALRATIRKVGRPSVGFRGRRSRRRR